MGILSTHFSSITMADFLKGLDILSNDLACSKMKAARLCHLVRINDHRLTTVDVGEIRNVPFVKNNDVAELLR